MTIDSKITLDQRIVYFRGDKKTPDQKHEG